MTFIVAVKMLVIYSDYNYDYVYHELKTVGVIFKLLHEDYSYCIIKVIKIADWDCNNCGFKLKKSV